MSPKIALVTGGNRGIGFEVTRQLAQHGLKVYLGSRNPVAGALAAGTLRKEGLDVSELWIDTNEERSIAEAVTLLTETHGKLDILINNAGLGDLLKDKSPSTVSVSWVRTSFENNVVATLAVTQSLLPLIQKAPAGRIVNVSSQCGSMTQNTRLDFPLPSFFAYSASKAALNMMTVQLAKEFRETEIVVVSVCPGLVKTDMTGHKGKYTTQDGVKPIIECALTTNKSISGKFWTHNEIVPW